MAALAFAVALGFQAARAELAEVEDLVLQAEAAPTPEQAEVLWQRVIEAAAQATWPEGIDLGTAQGALFEVRLELFRRAPTEEVFARLDLAARAFSDPYVRAWALIRAAGGLLQSDLDFDALELLRGASDLRFELTDVAAADRVLAGVAEMALSAPNGDPVYFSRALIYIRDLIAEMQSQRPTLAAWRAYASAWSRRSDDPAFFEAAKQDPSESRAETLADMVERFLDPERPDLDRALVAGLMISEEGRDRRKEVLTKVYHAAMEQDRFIEAVVALGASGDTNDAGNALRKLGKTLVDAGEVSRAAYLAAFVDDGYYSAYLWARVARAYGEDGYAARAEKAIAEALSRADTLVVISRRDKALAAVAKSLAESGDGERAYRVYRQIENPGPYDKTTAAVAKALATSGAEDRARELLENLSNRETGLETRRVLLGAMIRSGRLTGDEVDDRLTAKERDDDALSGDIAVAFGWTGDTQTAFRWVDRLKSPIARLQSLTAICRDPPLIWPDGATAELARLVGSTLAQVDGSDKQAQRSLEAAAAAFYGCRMIETADILAQSVSGKQARHRIRSQALLAQIDSGNTSPHEALDHVAALSQPDQRDALRQALADRLLGHGDIITASRTVQEIEDWKRRTQAFRRLAELQARQIDVYGLLAEGAPRQEHFEVGSLLAGMSEDELSRPFPAAAQSALLEESIVAAATGEAANLPVMRPMPQTALGIQIPTPGYLERLSASEADVVARTPPAVLAQVNRLSVDTSIYNTFNKKFIFATSRAAFHEMQQTAAPDLIFVGFGVVDLATLYDRLRAKGLDDYILRDGRVYTLRRPLVVGDGGTLVISGSDVDELRLVKEVGAYIVNAGELHITGTRVVSWREKAHELAWATYSTQLEFRPFMTAWSRSKTYIAGSYIFGLGYANDKAYGLSLTSGPDKLVDLSIHNIPRPVAVIVDNSFENMHYGFYSYEADDVVLVGNEYRANIIYGVDPHDRSRRLTMAFNTAYGALVKHGLIISREVSNSSFIGNLAFDNKGSGIMVDRESRGTMTYANTSFGNKQDGLTVFESDCQIVAANLLTQNGRSGITVRNSRDVGLFFNHVTQNGHAGLHAYTSDLAKLEKHANRDVELDPYSTVVALSAIGNRIQANKYGFMAEDLAALALRRNEFVDQSPNVFAGNIAQYLPYLFSRHDIKVAGVVTASRCITGEVEAHACRFRDGGYFGGDGQGLLDALPSRQACPAPSGDIEEAEAQ